MIKKGISEIEKDVLQMFMKLSHHFIQEGSRIYTENCLGRDVK